MVIKGVEQIPPPNQRHAAQCKFEMIMKTFVVALALVTPAAFAVAQDNHPDADAHQYRYGDVIVQRRPGRKQPFC